MSIRQLACVVLCLGIAACSESDPALRYQRWLEMGHQREVEEYTRYLRTEHLDEVAPIAGLLRSGRRWRYCRTDEFAVPPRESWAAMKPTLALVTELRAAGILGDVQIASAWRSPAFNKCEGGSTRSRHLDNNALDFDVAGHVDVARLCDYWRKHGAARRFGLGFYSPGEIHVDTTGFRTWGHDYHRGTSLCENTPPAR